MSIMMSQIVHQQADRAFRQAKIARISYQVCVGLAVALALYLVYQAIVVGVFAWLSLACLGLMVVSIMSIRNSAQDLARSATKLREIACRYEEKGW